MSKLNHIASLVREGYTSGYHPYWSIDVELTATEEEKDRIADLIEEGFTSGFYPHWTLSTNSEENGGEED